MIRRVQKFIACLLIVLLLSNSVLATGTVIEHNHSECNYSADFTQETEISLKEFEQKIENQRLNELLATLPENSTESDLYCLLSPLYPELLVLSLNEVLSLRANLDKAGFSVSNDLKGKMLESIMKYSLTLDGKVENVKDDIYIFAWFDIENQEIQTRGSIKCPLCGIIGLFILKEAFSYIFQNHVFPTVETWLIETLECVCGYIFNTDQTLVNVEYAPACSICLQTNNMTWNGYWWCTACNQNK